MKDLGHACMPVRVSEYAVMFVLVATWNRNCGSG